MDFRNMRRPELVSFLALILLRCLSYAENVTWSYRPALEKIPLYISGMFSMTVGWDGSGVLPAVELALEQVNQRDDILEDYDLRLIWDDSKCVSGTAPRILFDHIFTKPTKVIILGAACSPNTQAVAGAAHYWNLLTISYSSTSDALSDREKYPYFYRTVPIENAIYNPPRLWFMENYGWKRVGIIYENREVFEKGALDLRDRILAMNGSVITEVVDKEASNQVERLKEEDIRIIILYSYEKLARRIFCERNVRSISVDINQSFIMAYRVGLYGPGVFWSAAGWYESEWWLIRDGKVDCTAEELAEVVELSQYTALDVAPISSIEKETVGGITPTEFRDTMEGRVNTWKKYENITTNNYMAYAYDAAWAIALMLNRTADRLDVRRRLKGSHKRLEDFTYGDSDLSGLFYSELSETDFFGASGSVRFIDGERIGNSLVSQLRGTCSDGWLLILRYCYMVNTTLVHWTEASDYCASKGSQLILIDVDGDAINNLKVLVDDYGDGRTQWHVSMAVEDFDNEKIELPTNATASVNDTLLSDTQCPYVDNVVAAIVLGDCYGTGRPFVCQIKAKFELVDIAVYDAYEDDVIWTNEITWPGGIIPEDGLDRIVTRYTYDEELVSRTAYITFCAVAAATLVLFVILFIFDSRYILKNNLNCFTSPYISVVLLVGFILLVAAIPLTKSEVTAHLTDNQYFIMCITKTCLLSTGFTLVIGTMIGRNWRAYTQHVLKSVTFIGNLEIYLIIAVLLVIDAVCVTLVCVVTPSNIVDVTLDTTETTEANTVTIYRHFVKVFRAEDFFKRSLLLLGDKFAFLLAGSYLSFEVWKVNPSKYDDCKSFVWGVYNLLLCSVCGCFMGLLLRDSPRNQFILTSSLILVHCTVAMAVFYAPRLWIFASDRQKNEIIDYLDKHFTSHNKGNCAGNSRESSQHINRNSLTPAALINKNIQLTRQLLDVRRKCYEKFGPSSEVWRRISHDNVLGSIHMESASL